MTTLYEVRSFTYNGHGGDLAGVRLLAPEEELSTAEMQMIAADLGYSETAFVKRTNERKFHLRYFTPLAEVSLCGHATIAAFSLLKQLAKLAAGTLMIETLAGNLGVTISQDNMVFMEQTMPIFLTTNQTTNKLPTR
nr:PhzF family phenazine biosynthesis isomerase [Vagococcus allomyrinae]